MMVTIDGTPVAIEAGSLQVQMAIGQRSTCSFTVQDPLALYHFDQGMAVSVEDDDGTLIFSGFVDTSSEKKPGFTSILTHDVQCADPHYLADKRVAAVSFTDTLCGDMVSTLVISYLAAEGVIGQHSSHIESTQADFTLGTLVRATATGGGDVEMDSGVGAPTFTRATNAYDSTGTQKTSGTPRYETGKIGSAITIEEATTNLLSANQGSVETNTTGFSAQNATLTRITTDHWTGTACLQAVTTSTSSDSGFTTANIAGTAGQAYTCSAWVKATAGALLKLVAKDNTNSGTTTVNFTATGAWQRVTATITYGASSGTGLQLKVLTQGAQPLVTILTDGMQIEAKAYATSWVDGGATRNAETLTIPPAAVSVSAGTIGVWLYTQNGATRNDATVKPAFYATDTATSNIGLAVLHQNGNWIAQSRNDSGSPSTITVADSGVSAGAWHHFALAWDATSLIFYIDGVSVGTASTPNLPTAISAFTLGYGSTGGYLGTYFDDLFVSQRKLSSTEIATIANGSAASSSIGGNTTFYAAFDGNLTYGYGGFRTSPALDITNTGKLKSAVVSWHSTSSGSASTSVQTSIDGGATFQAVTNGGAVSGLTLNQDLSTTPTTLLVRQVFTTTDSTSIVAAFQDVTVTVRSNQIQDGQSIPSAVFAYAPVAQCMDSLAEQAGYWWVIDQHKKLWFQAPTAIAAPFAIDGSDMETDSVFVERTTPNYRNTQYILGVNALTSSQTETRKGDSTTRAFTMSFPFNNVPTVTVNAVAKTVGIKGIDTGKDFYWSKGDPVLAQDTGGTLLTSSDTLSVTYIGQYPAVVLSTDTAGITARQTLEGGTTTGIVEDAVSVANVNSTDQAFVLANAKLARFSTQGQAIQFDTLRSGLAPGQLLSVTIPAHGITSAQTLIESVSITSPSPANYLVYSVKAVIGPADTTWVQFFANLAANASAGNNISIGVSTTLALLQSVSESWTWSESVTETVFACPICGTSTFCGTGTIVC